MAYERKIPAWFSARKAAQVTAFFAKKAGGRINILRATKLIYLSDRLSMDERDHPITGDDFVSMRFGPVNTYTYSLMNGEGSNKQSEWFEFIAPRDEHWLSLSKRFESDADLDELSRAELTILEKIWTQFEHFGDQFKLADFTHIYCPEWRDPNGSSIPIDFPTIYNKLNKENPIELAEDIAAERAFKASLAG
jgi:uncharacterized phage-associated protein